ncbi:hypothetical protein skT53_20820 [Effusibacillus dendaii]|uniref:Uncharacterized protein n=1 Tax=Effusibacillus dendaii TaxID=2743772 RepID=A0A7I8DAT3_9BACL|nr:hypothetical protein skT53_20820 [Effusibacillus dendaii]
MVQKLQNSAVFQETQDKLTRKAFQEGFIDAAVAIEARDRKPEKKIADADELAFN